MEIDPLQALQSHDSQRDELEREMKTMRERLLLLEEEFQAAQSIIEELQSKEQDLKVATRETEGELDDLEKKKSQSEQKRTMVTSAKQLDAVNAQLEGLEQKTSEEESKLLELYERHEGLSSELLQAKEKLVSLEKSAAEERAEIARGLQERENQLANLQHERPGLCSSVEGSKLLLYEDLRKEYGGVVVFDIEDMACPGCGMAVPRQDFEKMKARRETFFECANCGRLLRYVGI